MRGAQERFGESLGNGWVGREGGKLQKTARPLGVNDGGHVVGEDHHRAKLTDHEIWLIHELRAAGVKRRDIAEKFEVSFHTICAYLTHRRRAHAATGQKPARRT